MSDELEISRLSHEEREQAFEQLMRSAQKVLPFIRGPQPLPPGNPYFANTATLSRGQPHQSTPKTC